MRKALFCLAFLPSIVWAAQPVLTGVERPVVVKAGIQFDPHISGAHVVFTDTSAGSADVWYADLTTGAQYAVASGEGDQEAPHVFGSDVVFLDWASGTGDIVLHNIAQGTNTFLGTYGEPYTAISKRLVAWEELTRADFNGDYPDIVVLDRPTGITTRITSAGANSQPAVSDANVVYSSDGAIKLYNADTRLTTTLFAGLSRYADIDGDHVILNDYSRGVADLTVINLSGRRLATLTLSEDVPAHISGDWVCFDDFSSGTWHVGLWHWTTGDLYSIGARTSRQRLSSISGNRVIYVDDRNSRGADFDADIYVYEFTLISADTTPPVLSVPNGIVVNAISPAGATVNFLVTATDDVDPHPAVACDHLSGSMYPIGSTTVQCTATDASGNSSSNSFVIVVRGAGEQIGDLTSLVNSFNLKQGIENSLDAKLRNVNAALAAANAGDTATACNLMAAFINEVNAQSGKALTSAQADQLRSAANQIRSVLGC